MDSWKYKHIQSSLSADRVLRQVEAHEQMGWSLYLLQPCQFFIFGSGGSSGLQAVMRRKASERQQAEE